MRPGSRGYVGGGLQPPGTGMRMATGEEMVYQKVYRVGHKIAPLFFLLFW